MEPQLPTSLPVHLQRQYDERRGAILARLHDFAAVPRDRYFYELCFCICTPQSKAVHADAVVRELEAGKFFEQGWDPTQLLRRPDRYIRFHVTKGARLLALRRMWTSIDAILDLSQPPALIRRHLIDTVKGLGMKEASHALRNIGARGLAIIDRHLLTNLVACGVYDTPPPLGSVSRYETVERRFGAFASSVGIDMDELDLLFWSDQAGLILK
jgi:N-glycosylase/DNA lyase